MQEPRIFRPFDDATFADIRRHVVEVRRCLDWPGIALHSEEFRRWQWHNLPLLKFHHHQPSLVALASDHAGEQVRASYAFLSLYASTGVAPAHFDRAQCEVTIDLMISTDASHHPWEIFIDGKPYVTSDGEAVIYSGTRQEHYRRPMNESSDATHASLAFFHFCPADFMGALD